MLDCFMLFGHVLGFMVKSAVPGSKKSVWHRVALPDDRHAVLQLAAFL